MIWSVTQDGTLTQDMFGLNLFSVVLKGFYTKQTKIQYHTVHPMSNDSKVLSATYHHDMSAVVNEESWSNP